jgi:hypothetical protein
MNMMYYGLSRNNGDIASDLRALTHHAHIDERREALLFDPRELKRYDNKFELRIQFMMSALVRQRDQRIAPLYAACLSIVAHRKSLDRFFWDMLTFRKVLYSRPKVESIIDELTTRLPDLPVFTSRSNSIGLAVIDNKAYFIKNTPACGLGRSVRQRRLSLHEQLDDVAVDYSIESGRR